MAEQNHKKPTKTQKKRRAENQRYEQGLPFHSSSTVCDPDPLSGDHASPGSADSTFLRDVPSLLSLCVVLTNKHFSSRHTLPKKICQILDAHVLHRDIKAMQIQWGLSILECIDQLEDKEKELSVNMRVVKRFYTPYSRAVNMCDCVRSSWDTSSRTSCTSCHMLPGLPGKHMGSMLQDGFSVSVLSRLIDCLLPPRIIGDQNIVKAAITAKIRVKRFLAKKWPWIELLFDHCMPYVWWSRGSFHLAEDAFSYLINTCHQALTKAYYLNELGRMFLWSGDRETAIKVFQKAAEILPFPETHAETTAMVLSAHSWDQGFLGKRSHEQAKSLWNVALHTAHPDLKELVAVASIESLLCYHGDN